MVLVAVFNVLPSMGYCSEKRNFGILADLNVFSLQNLLLFIFYPALLILLIGIINSLIILVVEIQVKMIKQKPKQPPLFVVNNEPISPFVM
ncbi:hypothetical protein BDFB_013105 [Asbolus verrucosus]|uniref:Uncharacterized protein n=1 Tax=Asbolus verrucosus TaxID=1661398 RepID=A0A482VMY8_ASBVE|nr:hypothetical protein BDFB_013105 [Asbolus verrucosus]